MADTEKTSEHTIIVNNRVGELGFYLSAYARVAQPRGGSASGSPVSKDSLQLLDKVRFMPGMNIPQHSAAVGQGRRAVTDEELAEVLKHPEFKRQVEMGTITVYKSLAEISVAERARIAKNCSDTTVLKAWLGQETHDKVKQEIAAQLAEINDKGSEGDYRDVREPTPEHNNHPGI